MGLYRALVNLEMGPGMVKRGEVFLGTALSEAKLGRLVELGKVEEATAPPLEDLPGWTLRVRRVEKAGITTVEGFVRADTAELAKMFKREAWQVDLWKTEALRWLAAPEVRR